MLIRNSLTFTWTALSGTHLHPLAECLGRPGALFPASRSIFGWQ